MKKILIVEDDKLAADLERDYLEASGFETEIAWNGLDGLRLAESKDYDLLLLDVMLPGMNGFEICREIITNAAKASRYKEAKRLLEVGDQAGAYCLFQLLGDYRDAEDQAKYLAGGSRDGMCGRKNGGEVSGEVQCKWKIEISLSA